MAYWACVFFVVALVTSVLGFAIPSIDPLAGSVSRTLFYSFAALFLFSTVAAIMQRAKRHLD